MKRRKHQAHVLIVEGAAAVGKTTLCGNLVREVASRDPIPSLFSFRQSFTYHPLNPDHPDTAADETSVKKHLAALRNLVRRLTSQRSYVLLESLHLTLAHRPGITDSAWFEAYDASMAEIGAKLVLIVADGPRHRAQLLKRSGTEFFSTYGRRYGTNEVEVVDYYVKEQRSFLHSINASTIPSLILDTSDSDATARALRFWEV